MSSTKRIFGLVVLLLGVALTKAQMPAADNGGQTPTPAAEQKRSGDGSPDALPSAVAAESNGGEKTAAQVLPPGMRFDVRYTRLRQGHDQEIAALLCPPEDPYCWFLDKFHNNQLVPVSLRIEPMEGFTIRYGFPRHYKSATQGTPAYHAAQRLIFLKVHAGGRVDPKGPLTIYTLVSFIK